MNRFERLVNLVIALYATERPLTREDIFRKIEGGYEGADESRRRAFERDKEALRNLGIPLVVTGGEGGEESRYQIDRARYEVPEVDLEPDELSALHVALAAVRLEGAADPESGLWKLGGVVGDDGTPSAGVVLDVDERLATLLDAANTRRVVTFRYRGGQRRVEPRGISSRGGHWYLTGRDQDREALRNFRLDRFESDPEVGPPDAFPPPTGPPPRPARPWEMGEGDPVTARVRVDAGLAGWVEADLGSDAVVEREDSGALVVELGVTSPAGLRSWLLGFLDRAELISPPELRSEMVSWLEAMA